MPGFSSSDPALIEVLRVAERAARATSPVLILGESGTGKNRLARFIHERSPRASGPFVEVACANVPPELFESDLFGHEQGAFTDAHAARVGRLEQAHRGTLFLDEIQEFELAVQAKLLRALEEKRFERVGGRQTLDVDVRILASTRENPALLVREGRLREDLLYRLDVIRLEIPPLRARRADIRAIAEAVLAELVVRHGLGRKVLSTAAVERLETYPWPGNVRELRHAIERAAILGSAETIGPVDLPETLSVASPAMLGEAARRGGTLASLERAYIDEVLRRTRGNKSAAARILGIHRKTLHEKLRASKPAADSS